MSSYKLAGSKVYITASSPASARRAGVNYYRGIGKKNAVVRVVPVDVVPLYAQVIIHNEPAPKNLDYFNPIDVKPGDILRARQFTFIARCACRAYMGSPGPGVTGVIVVAEEVPLGTVTPLELDEFAVRRDVNVYGYYAGSDVRVRFNYVYQFVNDDGENGNK